MRAGAGAGGAGDSMVVVHLVVGVMYMVLGSRAGPGWIVRAEDADCLTNPCFQRPWGRWLADAGLPVLLE